MGKRNGGRAAWCGAEKATRVSGERAMPPHSHACAHRVSVLTPGMRGLCNLFFFSRAQLTGPTSPAPPPQPPMLHRVRPATRPPLLTRQGRSRPTAAVAAVGTQEAPKKTTHPLAAALASALLSAGLLLGAPTPALADSRVFLDVAVDGAPAGRLTVRLFDDVPVGAARFADLARDRGGVGYVRSPISAVSPASFIASSGVARLSYSDVSKVEVAGGETVEDLQRELAEHRHSPEAPGAVSLTVAVPPEVAAAPVKTRLVAVKGKFVQVEEKRAAAPNGTGFVINLSPDGQGGRLEATNLAVGELVGGADVAARLSELKAAQPTADSPYFKLAKKLGDRRADVAEKYFLRPFQKVVVTASGVL